MSARIPDTMLLSDLLKPTGYDCPEELQGKTFAEATTGGGDLKVQTNKETTITENGIIVIEPDEGYDATKKVTATVNVPSSGGSATAYAWTRSDGSTTKTFYFDFGIAPDDFTNRHILEISDGVLTVKAYGTSPGFDNATKVSDTEFTISVLGTETTYTRDNTKDCVIW